MLAWLHVCLKCLDIQVDTLVASDWLRKMNTPLPQKSFGVEARLD